MHSFWSRLESLLPSLWLWASYLNLGCWRLVDLCFLLDQIVTLTVHVFFTLLIRIFILVPCLYTLATNSFEKALRLKFPFLYHRLFSALLRCNSSCVLSFSHFLLGQGLITLDVLSFTVVQRYSCLYTRQWTLLFFSVFFSIKLFQMRVVSSFFINSIELLAEALWFSTSSLPIITDFILEVILLKRKPRC